MKVNAFPALIVVLLCFPIETPADESKEHGEAAAAIEAAFGEVRRDANGTIIGVDLARERASATNDVLVRALSIPGLKQLRLAGSGISSENFRLISQQKRLEELFLQDVPATDDDLVGIVSSLPFLKRLTLRRMNGISPQGIAAAAAAPALRNLALIEMELDAETFRKISASKTISALDLRKCNGLTAEDYRSLVSMDKLVDLKIGGFSVDDRALDILAAAASLKGLSIEDTFITPKGFSRFVSKSASSGTIETFVLNRNAMLLDDALQPLRALPRLRHLTVADMMLTGSFLAGLAEEETRRPKFVRLSLRKTLLTPEAARALKKYPELRSLDLSGNAVTPELIETLASMENLEELDLSDCVFDEEILKPLRNRTTLRIVKSR